MIHMPQEATGKAWKLARAFHGSSRVLNVTPMNVEARLVDDLYQSPIFVCRSRVRRCYDAPGLDIIVCINVEAKPSATKHNTNAGSENRPLTRLQAKKLAQS